MPTARQSASVLSKVVSGGGANFQIPTTWNLTSFGSGWPIRPATDPAYVETPRDFDFPMAVNTSLTPRVGYGLMPFSMLLEAYDTVSEVRSPVLLILRELCSFIPHLVDFDGNEIEDHPYAWMAKYPDRKTPFSIWLTRFLKSTKVYDAPAVYKHRTDDGLIDALHYVDGSTLFVIVDSYGNIPAPESVNSYVSRLQASGDTESLNRFLNSYMKRRDEGKSLPTKIPAYTQIIKGTPYSWWSSDDIWYMPQSRRLNAPYGESFIEMAWSWIMIIVNITSFELSHYRTGNMPEGFITIPQDWAGNVAEMMALEREYNQRMTENPSTNRNRVRFFPDQAKYFQTKKADFPRDLYGQAWTNILQAIGIPKAEFGDIPGGGLGGAGFKEGSASEFGRRVLNPHRDFIASLFNSVLQENGVDDALFALDYPIEEIDPDKQKESVYQGMMHGVLTLNDALAQLKLTPIGNPDDKENIANKHLIVAGSTIYVIEDMDTSGGMAAPTFDPMIGGQADGMPAEPESIIEQDGKEHTPQDLKTLQEAIRHIQEGGTLDGKFISLPSGQVLLKAVPNTVQITQEQAGYTAQAANHNERCELCKYFVQDGSCQLVQGAISPDGWCKLFESSTITKRDARPGVAPNVLQNLVDAGAVASEILGLWQNISTGQLWVSVGDWASDKTFIAIRTVLGSNTIIEGEAAPPEDNEDYLEVSKDDPGNWKSITKLVKLNGVDPDDDDYFGAPVSRQIIFDFPANDHANGVEIVAMIPDGLPPKAALWKPEGDEIDSLQSYVGGAQYLREEAAYILDRSLEFYLTPVAYVAEINNEHGAAVMYTPGAPAGKPILEYAPEWIEKAAVLDYIMGQQDRGENGHNYLTHPQDTNRPVLFDNGLSFSIDSMMQCQSGFYAHWQEQSLSEPVLIALTVCRGDASSWSDIRRLVGAEATLNAMERLGQILALKTIPAYTEMMTEETVLNAAPHA